MSLLLAESVANEEWANSVCVSSTRAPRGLSRNSFRAEPCSCPGGPDIISIGFLAQQRNQIVVEEKGPETRFTDL